MRKNVIAAVALLLCVCLLSFVKVSDKNAQIVEAATQNQEVITVADNTKMLESRFLNMLNHSFVYDNDFHNKETLVNNSVLALLDLADNGFVSETYVSDYIFNMYGINVADFSDINLDFEQKQGYVYIVPRGYSVCEHKIISVTDNSDGSYTVVTNVEISLDDGTVITDTATTVFLQNAESQFGYNIVYSEIGAELESALSC
jgi:hypothetical protein